MIISNMNENHVRQIAELERLCFHDPWSENSIASELGNRLSVWLVALDEDKVVGYVGSQTVIDETDMMNIAVHPDYRNRGVATALIVELTQQLRMRGSKGLMLEVRESNSAAISLYEKHGFLQVGCRRNYYRNPRENAMILRKEL